jgi:hypothetical protein
MTQRGRLLMKALLWWLNNFIEMYFMRDISGFWSGAEEERIVNALNNEKSEWDNKYKLPMESDFRSLGAKQNQSGDLHKSEYFGKNNTEESVPLMILVDTHKKVVQIFLMTPAWLWKGPKCISLSDYRYVLLAVLRFSVFVRSSSVSNCMNGDRVWSCPSGGSFSSRRPR